MIVIDYISNKGFSDIQVSTVEDTTHSVCRVWIHAIKESERIGHYPLGYFIVSAQMAEIIEAMLTKQLAGTTNTAAYIIGLAAHIVQSMTKTAVLVTFTENWS